MVDFEDTADVYIINTCTVTHLGDRKSRQLIRRAVRANPAAVIAVTGCYAQTSPGELTEIPGVDLVIGTRARARLVDLVENTSKGRRPVNAVSEYAPGDEFEEIAACLAGKGTRISKCPGLLQKLFYILYLALRKRPASQQAAVQDY